MAALVSIGRPIPVACVLPSLSASAEHTQHWQSVGAAGQLRVRSCSYRAPLTCRQSSFVALLAWRFHLRPSYVSSLLKFASIQGLITNASAEAQLTLTVQSWAPALRSSSSGESTGPIRPAQRGVRSLFDGIADSCRPILHRSVRPANRVRMR